MNGSSSTRKQPIFRWHYHFGKKFWYAKRNDATRAFAPAMTGLPAVVSKPTRGFHPLDSSRQDPVVQAYGC